MLGGYSRHSTGTAVPCNEEALHSATVGMGNEALSFTRLLHLVHKTQLCVCLVSLCCLISFNILQHNVYKYVCTRYVWFLCLYVCVCCVRETPSELCQ